VHRRGSTAVPAMRRRLPNCAKNFCKKPLVHRCFLGPSPTPTKRVPAVPPGCPGGATRGVCDGCCVCTPGLSHSPQSAPNGPGTPQQKLPPPTRVAEELSHRHVHTVTFTPLGLAPRTVAAMRNKSITGSQNFSPYPFLSPQGHTHRKPPHRPEEMSTVRLWQIWSKKCLATQSAKRQRAAAWLRCSQATPQTAHPRAR
jgi:hypothetical protein